MMTTTPSRQPLLAMIAASVVCALAPAQFVGAATRLTIPKIHEMEAIATGALIVSSSGVSLAVDQGSLRSAVADVTRRYGTLCDVVAGCDQVLAGVALLQGNAFAD